jgi:hypothetical protein
VLLNGIRNTLGNFKGVQNFVPNVCRFFHAFHTRCPFAPGVVSVIESLRTRGDDQRVVFEAFAVSELDTLAQWIDICDLAEQNASIFLAAQHAAQRSSNLAGRKRACRHLIQQRLEQMIITPIDKRHVDGR